MMRAWLQAWVLGMVAAATAAGQAPGGDFDYARALWRVSDGLPEETVQALAESRDGMLWVGTSGGLAEFDGARIRPAGQGMLQGVAANSIFCMTFAADGSLWAGTEGGGLLRVRDGASRVYAAEDGLTDEFVRSVTVDRGGTVWAGTDDGVFRLEGERFRRVDGRAGMPAMAVHSVLHDREGRTWVGGSRLVALDADGRPQEYALPGAYSENRVKKILETRDGTVWVGTVGGLDRLRDGRFEAVPGIHATVRSLLEARDGTLWIGTIGDGLWTYAAGKLTRISGAGVLPSETVLAIFEDTLGQIWIGTQAGLVRLDRTPVSVVALPEGGDPDFETISGDASGDVWVSAQHLYGIRNGVARRLEYDWLKDVTVRMVFRARNGDLWIGSDGAGAYRVRGAEVTHYTAPGELTNNFVRGFLESRAGEIWIATDEGVSRIGSAGAAKFTEANGLVFFSTRSLLEDRGGSIWIGTDHGLSRWKDGSFQQDAATRGLASEKVWSILEDREGTLWFGTRDHGLFRFRGGELKQWTTEQGLPSNSVYQLLQDRRGTFWISGPNTIASISAASMRAESPTADRPLSVQVYDMPFGADGAQMYGGRQPAGYVAPDDSVWFATTRGAARVAHAEVAAGAVPQARIEEIDEDGRDIPHAGGEMRVGSGVSRLSFGFTAVSLRSQKGVRFRYKLENFDSGWTVATADRTATYTNLPAGHYRFRVVAFDTAEPGNVSEADVALRKMPFFYQTWWFYAVCAGLIVALAWLVYQLRVRQIRTRFQAVLAERSRLAREMHDTVIQGCTGISALLEAMATTGAEGELLEFARVQARTTIAEARQAVWNMRHEENDVDLIESIEGVAAQTMREFGTQVEFQHELQQLRVGAGAAHEILMTVREAVYNSVQHSGTKEVALEVTVRGEEIAISIADRGRGIAAAGAHGEGDGHYGILGMRERMQRLGGEFVLESIAGAGTSVRLKMPRAARSRGGER